LRAGTLAAQSRRAKRDWGDSGSGKEERPVGGDPGAPFSAETRKEGRGMHPSALAGAFAAPAVGINVGPRGRFTITVPHGTRLFFAWPGTSVGRTLIQPLRAGIRGIRFWPLWDI